MNKKRIVRGLCSAAIASTLAIALSSCGSSDNTGKLKTDEVYAQAGDYKLTYGELWNELKWQSESVLEQQAEVVILQDYIDDIKTIIDGSYDKLTDDNKTRFSIEKEADYDKIKKTYSDRLVDYVIQDIYNLTFSMEDYYESLESVTDNTKKLLEAKYVDEAYTNYQVSVINGKNLSTMVAGVDAKENYDNYLEIATSDVLREAYFYDYAKELFGLAKKAEEVKEADDADDNDDDNRWGYYDTSEYISQFKTSYTHLNKVDIVLIRFTSTDEFTNTLRAFGIKAYNGKYYYIADTKNMSYDEYVEYYDDLSTTQYTASNNVQVIDSDAVLEIFIQLYNYIYGGYRPLLSSGNTYKYDGKTVNQLGLDNLRYLTNVILEDYSFEATKKYNNAAKYLTETNEYRDLDNDTRTLYTADELNTISRTLGNLIFDDLDSDTPAKRYSTSTTSISSSYYIAFKLGEEPLTADDYENYEELQEYADYYNTDLKNYEILKYIEKKGLRDTLEKEIIKSRLTDSEISNYLTSAKDDITIKIFNEACEISYQAKNTDYSRTLGSADNENILATFEYNNKTYNLNIVADNDDSNSIKIVGTDKAFGVFDYLEKTTGATTAIDLISKKIVKDTNAFKDTEKDMDVYERYLESILYSFTNGYYATSGYPASIGKYNFMMLYFHSADVNEIIDNYYRVQFASAELLTDYSSDKLVDFFKTYTDLAFENYFSINATRLYVYFDGDDDGKADDVEDWYDHVITEDESSEFKGKTRAEVAKQLILDVYTLISASTSSHTDRLSEIVTEIQGSARAEYETNPIVAENRWAKYLHLGFNVSTEDISATNSSVDIDFNIKQRLYDYFRGHNNDNTKTYQYIKNETTPTCYIEALDNTSVSKDNDDIISSQDGYNLLLVTGATIRSSAKFEEKENKEGLYENVYFKYNDSTVIISDIYNDLDSLNKNQIKYYVVDYAINGSSKLTPSSLSDAYSAYLSSAMTRYTGSETQRIILLSFIKNKTNSDKALYDVIKFANDDYNGENGVFANFIQIDQRSADNYIFVYNDTTSTSDQFTYVDKTTGEVVTWWDEILKIVNEFLLKDEKEAN